MSSDKTFAILFIHYKEPEICMERLSQIRGLNPWVPIYGLYGGTNDDIPSFNSVHETLDDNWNHPSQDPKWKWKNLDLMIADWYAQRGHTLNWQYLFIYSWDVLLLDPIQKYLSQLSQKTLLWLPGVYNYETLQNIGWCWIQPFNPVLNEENEDFLKFCTYLTENHISLEQIRGGGMLLGAYSREFLQSINPVIRMVPGFCEYRISTLANILGYSFIDWVSTHNEFQFVNYTTTAIPYKDIQEQAGKIDGARLFHPVYGLNKVSLQHIIYEPNQ